jgi:anti-sigma B factor antagonist
VEHLISIRRTEVRGHVVVHVTGEVEAMTAERFADAVTAALDEGRPVVVDLTDVAFLDSAGLTALLQVTERGMDRGEPLRLAVDQNRPVVRPIEITGLEARLALYDSVDDATSRPG